jgi:hypothetical protein
MVRSNSSARALTAAAISLMGLMEPISLLAYITETTVVLSVMASRTASGLTSPCYRWWQYEEADSAESKVTITDASTPQASFIVPNEADKQVHMILEVMDNGAPPLVRYQRIVYSIQ